MIFFRSTKTWGSPPLLSRWPPRIPSTTIVFLPNNINLICVGNVRLEFAPSAEEITYGKSRTWSPLNILGACYIDKLEIYCKNGRYCIHDDSHNAYQGTMHYYHNVRCTYELGDMLDMERRLGYNNTIGNGMALGTFFMFENCVFEFRDSSSNSTFYTHKIGSGSDVGSPTLIFKNCQIEGGIYPTIYRDISAQHFDVTFINSGTPLPTIDRAAENPFPIKYQ